MFKKGFLRAEALFIQAGRVWRGKEGLNLLELGKWAWMRLENQGMLVVGVE